MLIGQIDISRRAGSVSRLDISSPAVTQVSRSTQQAVWQTRGVLVRVNST